MKQFPTVTAALIGSASALGYNWIYDRPLLNSIKDKRDMVFAPIDHDLYKKAKNAFDVYPNHDVGDLDFMGEMLYQLHQYLKQESLPTPQGFFETVYKYINKEGPYDGYIEGYGKDLITRYENDEKILPTPYIDKQLIGPAIYFVIHDHFKEHRIKHALRYASVFTSYKHTKHFIIIINQILKDLEQGLTLKETLKHNIKNAPKDYQDALSKALTSIDVDTFIKDYSGVACGLNQAFPLIYYILAHNETLMSALQQNSILGGASSARGIFIAAIMSKIDTLKKNDIARLNVTI